MKKAVLFTLLLLVTILVNGQTNKLSLGITGSPDFYNYNFQSLPGFDHDLKNKANFSAGLQLGYYLAQRVSVHTGLHYSTKGYIVDYHWNIHDENDPAVPGESNITLSYLEIPIMVSYDILNKEKFKIFASTGILVAFLVDDKEIVKMGDGSKSETTYSSRLLKNTFNKTVSSSRLQFGFQYNLNKNFYFSLSPYLSYGLNKISDQILKDNPFGYGMSISFGIY